MNVILCFLPVILFLTFLFLLDSFNLVRVKTLILCLLWGTLCAVSGYFFNTLIAKWLALDFSFLSRYIAPFIEETLKALFVFYLISKKKIGFMIDAAIYGFAIGAGFSLVENFYFLFNAPPEFNTLTWIIRGIGTASMHGGCTSFFAVLFVGGINRSENRLLSSLPGLLLAILLHSGFNHFPLNPVLQTLLMIVLLPIIFVIVFRLSNSKLQHWLEIEFNSEVEILNMIRKGVLRSTNTGSYLMSVKERFTPETIVDMYCYIALYLELSIKAKRNLMLKENDFPIIVEDDLESKLKELALLRKQIGTIGELTLAPLIRMNYRNLWKLNQLKS
ncbi:MAG: PrsW family glutamic-type intramembrane protease [Bacteroidota bacterium]